MRFAICDDNYAFLRGFQARLSAWCQSRGVACGCSIFITPTELLFESIDNFDVVFLNVDMGCWDGIHIAKTIREQGKNSLIILVSEHLRFAPDGYGVGAFRYLLKSGLDESFAPAMDDTLALLNPQAASLTVLCNKEPLTVPLKDILYAESDKRVVRLNLVGEDTRPVRCYMKLGDLEAQLAAKGFLRVHKSFLVNLRHVRSIKNYTVTLNNGATLQTSRQNFRGMAEGFKQWKEQQAAGLPPADGTVP